MFECIYVNIPEYLSPYLRENMQTTGEHFKRFKVQLSKDKVFYAVVMRALGSIDPRMNLDHLLKNLGWLGIRNRLAAFYLNYHRSAFFLQEYNQELVSRALRIEDKLSSYTVQGHSRGFLLALYLELGNLITSDKNIPIFDSETMSLLKLAASKVPRIDWTILFLYYSKEILGYAKVAHAIKKQIPYSEMIGLFSEEQIRLMMGNMLTYSASIGEPDFFAMQMV